MQRKQPSHPGGAASGSEELELLVLAGLVTALNLLLNLVVGLRLLVRVFA